MRNFASQSILTVWYAHLNIENALADYKATLSRRKLKQSKSALKKTEARLAKARARDSCRRSESSPASWMESGRSGVIRHHQPFPRLRGRVAIPQ